MEEINDEEIEAIMYPREAQGIVECYNCDYFGTMIGYVDATDDKYIQFVCPECHGIEKVKNSWGV